MQPCRGPALRVCLIKEPPASSLEMGGVVSREPGELLSVRTPRVLRLIKGERVSPNAAAQRLGTCSVWPMGFFVFVQIEVLTDIP